MPVSQALLCSLPFVSWKLSLKELVILLVMCVVEKCFLFYVFSFPPGVYVGTLNLIALIPGSSVLTLNV